MPLHQLDQGPPPRRCPTCSTRYGLQASGQCRMCEIDRNISNALGDRPNQQEAATP